MVSEDIVGGRLKFFLDQWKNLTSDRNILEIISGAKIEFDCHVEQNYPRKPINCSNEDRINIDAEIRKYLNLGIIERCCHSKGEFVNQIFPTPKKNGGLRIILNLKPLNMDVHYSHFKMENLTAVLELIEPNCYMASIDLRDAYYSVNIQNSYRKFLRFIWDQNLFQFTCLPNGLSSAPRIYTKLMKPIFASLRSQGYISVYYLDDTWLMGRTRNECLMNVNTTCNLLKNSGFLINVEKSQFEPSQRIIFLGFEIDSVNMIITLPNEKVDKVIHLCTTLLKNNSSSIRFVAQVIGVLVSTLPAVQYSALFYRFLEIDKISALRSSKGNYDASMSLSDDAKAELQWWINSIRGSFKLI